MATRYNAYGWYNPYAPVQTQEGLTAGLTGGQQPLKGIIVPVTGGPAWVTEPGLNNGFVEVKNEHKVHADPPAATSSTTTTVITNGGTNTAANGGTTTSGHDDQLSSNEKSQFRQLGVALCILSAFTLGIAVSYIVVDYSTTACPLYKKDSASPGNFYYWGVRVAGHPFPIFTFVIGVLCIVIRDRKGGQIQSIYGMAVFSFVLLVPLIFAGGIGGILSAYQGCATTTIEVIYLVLPAFLLFMALILCGLLIYLLIKLALAKKVPPAVKPTPTTTSITTTTTTTPAATTPSATIPAPPTQVAPPVPAQPLVLQQYAPQMPTQPNYVQPAYQPANLSYPSPYQRFPPRYPPRPPPMFGASPYMRLPSRSPYGYNPYSRPPRPYRPNSYY